MNMAILFVVEQPGGKPFEFGAGIAGAEARQYVAALLRQMRGAGQSQERRRIWFEEVNRQERVGNSRNEIFD